MVESVTKQYLKKCTYHKVTDSLCPVFELGYIVKESGQNFTFLAVKVLKFQIVFLAVDGRGTLAVQSSPAVEMIFCFLKNSSQEILRKQKCQNFLIKIMNLLGHGLIFTFFLETLEKI